MARERYDTDKLKAAVPLEDIVGQVVDLRKAGSELKGLCPFHSDKSPSFTLNPAKQFYYCFGCGASGSHINFLMDHHNLDFLQAAAMLEQIGGGASLNSSTDSRQREVKRAIEAPQEWQHIATDHHLPAPKTVSVNRDGKWIKPTVKGAWCYRNTDGQLLGYTCRIEIDGKKDVMPLTHKVSTKTGAMELRQGALPVPRSLYGAELLSANPSANIVLVEGEKSADAARSMLEGTGLIVMTWPGGCQAVEKADWSLLSGRKIVGWPDCDSQRYADNHEHAGALKAYHLQPGMAAMLRIAQLVEHFGAKMMIVRVPKPGGEWPAGYDLADALEEGKDKAWVLKYIGDNKSNPADLLPKQVTAVEDFEMPEGYQANYEDDYQPVDIGDSPSAPDSADDQSETLKPVKTVDLEALEGSIPFRILGVDQGRHFYLPDGVSQIYALTASQHTKLNLYYLAPAKFWAGTFGSDKKGGDGVNWDMAVDTLMRRSEETGIYDPERIRGRGAWWDQDKWAVHLGNKVVMGFGDEDPTSYPLRAVPSEFIYEAGKKISISLDDPLSTVDAYELVKILQRLSWKKPMDAKLLAGFIFLAPICGALDWRPHAHLTGGAGSGKTTVMTKIVGRCLKGIGLIAEGDTSEAGLRQALGHDARPVIFDEFESERKKAAERTQDVLSMATRASSETEGFLLKGGADGKATSYKSRAMFLFSSIGVNIQQHAARTRITILELISQEKTPESTERFKELAAHIVSTLTPEYVSKLQARAVRMIPIIRKNCQIFTEASTLHFSDSRAGDQIGSLLAGAYGLHSTNVITLEMAKQFIEGEQWDEVDGIKDENDEASLVAHLLAKITRVEVAIGQPKSRNIASLISLVGYPSKGDQEVSKLEAGQHLERIGVKVMHPKDGSETLVLFANKHSEIKAMLRDTPWEHGYERTLLRFPGASKCEARSFAKTSPRSTQIPLSRLIPEHDD